MIKNILIVFPLMCCVSLFAQSSTESSLILRSTTSISTPSSTETNTHILQQSSGQASISGSYESGEYLLSQGFVQMDVWSKMIKAEELPGMEVSLYPNPFIDKVHVVFSDFVSQPVEVFLFNDLGHVLLSKTYKDNSEINLALEHLPAGKYFVKTNMNNKYSLDRLIKVK